MLKAFQSAIDIKGLVRKQFQQMTGPEIVQWLKENVPLDESVIFFL